MAVAREFLGWDGPMLPRAAGWLLDHYTDAGVADMSPVVAVVPGSRGGRRLTELLVDQADTRKTMLIPPRVITGGPLPEMLYESPMPAAGEVACQQAWVEALRAAPADILHHVVPHPPVADDLPAWWALADMLTQLHDDVAAAGLNFAEVPEAAADLPGFTDADRWTACAAIQRDYLARLQAAGVIDKQQARLRAIADNACRTDHDIILIATPEGGRALRQMLEQVSGRVTSLIFAPGSLADRFDEVGWVNADAWRDAPLDLPDDRLHVVMRPIDQARTVLRVIESFDAAYRADQISIGLLDADVAPYLKQQLPAFGLTVHDAAGQSLARTAPVRLLSAVADYLADRRHADYTALVRHPDLTAWLLRQIVSMGDGPGAIDTYLTWLDEYYNEHLVGRMTQRWLGASRVREQAKAIADLLHGPGMLGLLDGRRPLSEWAQPIVTVVAELYGGCERDRTDPADRAIIQACRAVADAAGKFESLPASLDLVCSASHAVSLLVRNVSDRAIGEQADEPAIELLGALALPLDDAEALVITGFNEGMMPTSVNADAFCPDRLRRHLGMVNNHRRYARDRYALEAIMNSRRRVDLITGRVTSQGDPLKPSRLLFACDPRKAAERILRFYGEAQSSASGQPTRLQAGADRPIVLPPHPVLTPAQPVRYMRVTDFKAFLGDPYRFALARMLNLRTIDDAATELDALRFGSLAHDVLNGFGKRGPTQSTDPDEIAAWLSGELHRQSAAKFGDDPLPAVNLQLAQLDRRLGAFAMHQAKRSADGWRIVDTEVDFRGEQAAMIVDDQPMYLHGRIDRIDRHEPTGRWAVYDYKTSEDAQTPEQVHQTGRTKQWVDLQLPLYRHLMRQRLGDGVDDLELGYIALPRKAAATGWYPAQWTESDLRSADDAAAEVIRAVRRNRFEFDPSRPAGRYDEFAYLCGVGQMAADDDEDQGGDA